ncbi:kinesin-like protein KIF24 isoform X2 [Mixophyes fleayi]
MASCLLECLCEAELEQYYPHFVAVGLQKIEELAEVTMKDYSKLGVHSMEDRKRLFQLIKIIQSVAAEDSDGKTPLQPGCVYLQPPHSRSATRRQLQFDYSNERHRDVFPASESRIKSPAEICDRAPPAGHHRGQTASTTQGEENSGCSTEGSCGEALRGTAPGLGDIEGPIIHRVMHVSGYNYGVPQTHLRPSAADKEEPWTDSDKICVCVRKRPLGLREERRGELSVVTVEDRQTVLIYEKKEAVNLKEYILQHVFYFDEVFSETFSNQDVYMKTAYPLIQHVFNGGNAACFAYGQTGAGKTHTMIGTQKNPGLYALAARDIFQLLESSQPRKDHSVWISFFEIYCGQLYDLLNGRKRLHAREDGKHVVQVVGLREVQVKSVDFLLEMILKGSRERSTGATGVNSDSSRSHAVIQIQIKDGRSRKLGRMSFIDLAGSERASDARESDKQTKMEGAEINQSLLALKECIRALDQEQAHTPFRQSKLTQVLKDSFIGNSKTCMIANISPSHIATEHTLNTLRYADRVKELKKGLRCATACSNRGRSASCLSPKRVQNPSAMLGEKVSPKKVKLGSQHSSTSKPKLYPSVFHPSNIPLSSTPKACTKPNTVRGSPSHAWLSHTTPVKGVIRVGKKKMESNQDKNPTPRNPYSNKSEMIKELKENNNLSHNRQTMQRVLAVQPVQKQIVSRDGMSFGDTNTRTFNSADDPVCRNTSSDLRVLPEQKEREERLRYYHQQFQHPPILHQKLHYQPLQKVLGRYKPQEVTVGHVSSSTSQRKGQPLEDPDDSDFSEDSFSYSSNQKKGRKEETVRERLSFFLHQGSPNAETRKCSGRGQGLCFNYSESHEHKHTVNSNCVSSCSSVDNGGWSSKDDSTSPRGSSDISNTPEKPYSSQEDLPKQLKKRKDPSSMHSPLEDISTDFGPLHEQSDRTSPLIISHVAGATLNSEHTEESMNNSSDSASASALMAPLTVSLLQDNWSVECTRDLETHASPKSDGGSENATFDKNLTIESHVDDLSVENNLSALVKQMLRYNESLHYHSSQQREKDWLPESSYGSQPCSVGSPQFRAQQGLCDKSSPRSANPGQSPSSRQNDFFSTGDSSLDIAISSSGDQPSPYYDADNEETSTNHVNYEITTLPWVFGRKTPEGTAEAVKESDQQKVLNKTNVFKPVANIQSKSIGPPAESDGRHQESNAVDIGQKGSEDSNKLPFRDCELEHLKNKLMKCIFAHRGVKEDKIPKCVQSRDERGPRTKSTSAGQLQSIYVTSQQGKSLAKAHQLVVHAHCKQLNEMSVLRTQEEKLLRRSPNLDFQEYVKKLDEILVLKCTHIESLRAQLRLCLGYSSAPSSAHEKSPQEVIDCLCCS